MFLQEHNLDFYKLEEVDAKKFNKEQVESAIKLHEDLKNELKGTIISYLLGLVIAVLKRLINHLAKKQEKEGKEVKEVKDEADKDTSKRNK